MTIERKGGEVVGESESCDPKTLYDRQVADALPTLKVARDGYDGTAIGESQQHPQRPLMRSCPGVYVLDLIIPTTAESEIAENVSPAL